MADRICNNCMHRPVCLIHNGVFQSTRGNNHLNLHGKQDLPGTYEDIFKALANACYMYEVRESLT